MSEQERFGRSGARRRAWSLVCVTGLVCALGPAMSAQGQVQWRTGAGAAPKKVDQKGLARLLGEAARKQVHVVAHFEAALTEAQKAALKQAGLEVLDYAGANAYYARVKPGYDAARIAGMGVLLTVEEINPAWKLHPDLHAGIIRGWTVVEGVKDQPMGAHDDTTVASLEARGQNPTLAMTVMLHTDVAQGDGEALVRGLGGSTTHRYKTVNGLAIHLPMSKYRELASSDLVRYIEPIMMPLTTCNDDNRVRTGVDTVNQAPYGLNGAGVDVLVYDGGTIAAHPGLAPRITTGDASGVITHATHVAGTIGGTGSGEAGNPHRGMAPGVRAFLSYGVQGFGNDFFRNAPQTDTENDYLAAIGMGADVANNSVGNNIESNGYPCPYQGDYGLFNEMLDSLIRGERVGQNGEPFRTIWAAGNERQGSRCDVEGFGDFYSIAPPQAGKNQVCVGAINSNDDSITTFTSWGPTDDGRLKPDFCAPGCQSDGDNGVTSCAGASGYTSLCGTSMASPTTCGIAALFIQDWRQVNTGMPDPLNSTIKTIFAHTAIDLDDPGPDYKTGYGSIRAPRIMDQLRSGNWIENQVGQGDVYSFVVVVSPTDTEFKVTIAWDDYRGNAAVQDQLVNDLDLVVMDPSGTRRFPWTLNPQDPDAPAVRTGEDHRNNIEQVFVANPMPGGWLCQVRGTNVPQGPQRFSLAASPLLVNCSDAGSAQLDRSRYSCGATSATLRAVDCGLNTSDSVIDTVNVLVTSTSDPSGEVVTLTETSAESAAFLGSVGLSTSNTPGSLQIGANDTITLLYIDADDGSGGMNVMVTDTASVDCTPPTISNVVVGNVMARSAVVTYTTDESAQTRVRFGTTCGSLSSMSDQTAFGTTHSVTLTGLTDDTTYRFAIEATDEAANSGMNNNGGACFTFTTPPVPDFYTEEFTGDNDLNNWQITFTPTPGHPDFYTACGEPRTTLNIDPTGHTVLGLTDDSSAQAVLAGGQQVRIYGMPFSSFFVGSNGYITFGSGSSDYTESLTEHFQVPRISLRYDDLLPDSPTGNVRWSQLSDRAVVTYANIRRFASATTRMTMQAEMFFDGTLRLTWLSSNATEGISGLSAGTGLDPAFLESDLSTIGCAPPCACDWDNSGGVNSQDFFDFLTDFFASAADFNNDGTTNSQDFFDFIACFFTPCP
ncbi:MAG: S8 family serine peptidase [Phycisphaerales bacterium]